MTKTASAAPATERKHSPVFVMGCHRSGTNLLYDLLLSAGGFAVYRGYVPIYKMLIPRCGPLSRPESRKMLADLWLRSEGCRRSGLDAAEVSARLLECCQTGGDFLRIIMGNIARNQQAQRWAVYDPDNVLYIPRIKADIPEALFVHIIRDGRDIALSLKKMAEFRPFFWDRRPRDLLGTAAYWEWMVRKGRDHGRQIPADYIEVRYEELVSDPRRTLGALGDFLDHDLDYDRIEKASVNRPRESNSSFRNEPDAGEQSPVNRWKKRLSGEEVRRIEAVVGECLQELGYPLSTADSVRTPGPRERIVRALYPMFLNTKAWLKVNTPAGRLTNLTTLQLEGNVAQKGRTNGRHVESRS